MESSSGKGEVKRAVRVSRMIRGSVHPMSQRIRTNSRRAGAENDRHAKNAIFERSIAPVTLSASASLIVIALNANVPRVSVLLRNPLEISARALSRSDVPLGCNGLAL
jgi:hypothetical protein